MGKARKHSRSGLVHDYDEYEEAPASKRGRFSLTDGVRKEVLDFSRITPFERRNLLHKLKTELQQVKEFRKKIACMSSDTVLLSPYSDIHSCSDGPTTQGKKQRPPPRKKGVTFAKVMKECQTLLDRVWSHKWGFAFRVPVDPVLLNIPDYFTVVKHPMDLGTVKSRLQKDEYASPLDFAADVRLTFANSIAYNPPGNQYHKMARELNVFFETRWKTIEKKIPVFVPLTSSASLESEVPFERKKVDAVSESMVRVEPVKLVMSVDEKKRLSEGLMAIEDEMPLNISDVLREQTACVGQSGEEIEVDFEALPDETLFVLRKLLDEYLREKKKSQEKSEACEMEIVHDSGFSNSPLQASKGDVQVDEDVDIVGGNDPPVSSHPPLKIEKDAARNNECSSSSSSSSESGSSSSDSGSCSSSGSETESIKASKRTSTEDKKEPGVGINSKEDVTQGEKIVVNDSLNEMGQVERDVGEKSTAMDAVNVLPDEETAPPERQLSPEKRYRAALLKNRFADTIMKAREKALTKGEKGDPERLRIEREEFEKRLREEKLRLQAEAKAAEEARRKAKAEAAEKARKEIEQEREAARQALQKMEKTVEINEGRRFMEDLELLRATGSEGDQLPAFMEEMSPKFSQDMLGSFKMEGNSNPLEQLGLYMKMDEDEDEDDEEDQPHFSQGEVDEQSLDRKEMLTHSPCGAEGEDQVISGNEEPVRQKVHDNGNQDEKPINHNEGEEQLEDVPLSPQEEDGDDQLASGNEAREEMVSEKAQESGSYEDGELINQSEGKEQLENVPEQENEFVDMVEEEAEIVNKGETETVDMTEVETETALKGEVETEVVDKGDQETLVVDKGVETTRVVDTGEVEAGVADKGEEETTTVNMEEVETEIVDKREEETETVDMADVETEIVDKREEETETVEMAEVETEIVDRREEETETVDMAEVEMEILDKRVEETETVDMTEVETEIVDKREEETETVVMAEVETEIVDKREEDTEVINMREIEDETVDKGEQETQIVDNGGEETVDIDMGEEDTKVVDDMRVLEAEIVDKGVQETEVVDNTEVEAESSDMGEENTEGVNMREVEEEIADMGKQETLVVNNGEENTHLVDDMRVEDTEIVDNGREEIDDMGKQETPVVNNGEGNTQLVDDMRVVETKIVDKGVEETEVVGNREAEPEIAGNGEEETIVVDKKEEGNELVIDKGGEEDSEDVEIEID